MCSIGGVEKVTSHLEAVSQGILMYCMKVHKKIVNSGSGVNYQFGLKGPLFWTVALQTFQNWVGLNDNSPEANLQ